MRRVLILGSTKTWLDSPYRDPSWEVWGLNNFWRWWGPYASRWFEIHPLSILRAEGGRQIEMLQASRIPVYMIRHYPSIPMSVRYPFEAVSRGHARLFTSTFCYQLALAIHERVDTIGIWGVDFSRGTLREQTVERMAIAYWAGVAVGQGIKLSLPAGSQLLTHRYRYGLDYWNEVRDTRRMLKSAMEQKVVDGAQALERKMAKKRKGGK